MKIDTLVGPSQGAIFDQPPYTVRVGGSAKTGGAIDENFSGSMSCVQFYEAELQPAAVHFRKNCTEAVRVRRVQETSLCPEGFEFFDGVCYMVSCFGMYVQSFIFIDTWKYVHCF